jgi:hypothetical protein
MTPHPKRTTMNMTTTLTAHPHRVWPVVVLAALAAIAAAIAVKADDFTGSSGTDRPVPITAVTNSDATRAPGDGLPCPIHQSC